MRAAINGSMQRNNGIIPPYDPFNFMLNHLCSIDDNNCYVEEFDTLDETHWEIAVNVEKQLLELLDKETQSEEYE